MEHRRPVAHRVGREIAQDGPDDGTFGELDVAASGRLPSWCLRQADLLREGGHGAEPGARAEHAQSLSAGDAHDGRRPHYGSAHVKLAPSSVLPVPLYLAT